MSLCSIALAYSINHCTATLIVGPKGSPPVGTWILEDRTTGRITALPDSGMGANVEIFLKGNLEPWHTYTLSAHGGAAFTASGGTYTDITFSTFKAFNDDGTLASDTTAILTPQ